MHSEYQSAVVTPRRDEFQRFELHCLRMVALGASLQAISKTLSLTENDIERYLHDAESRLGAHNRLHAVSLALKIGILDEAPTQQSE